MSTAVVPDAESSTPEGRPAAPMPVAEPTDVPSPGLAARYYLDDRIAGIEKDHIFARTWQLACHESDLTEVGAGSWCRSPGAR